MEIQGSRENKKKIEKEAKLAKLKEIIARNNELPPEKRVTKYDILIEAGYSHEVASALSGQLIQNGKVKVIPQKGFDADSAKLVLQELMHDSLVKDEIRLKAAEDTLKIHGEFKDGSEGSPGSTSAILAGILRDIFNSSTKNSKVKHVVSEQQYDKQLIKKGTEIKKENEEKGE